MGQQHPPLGMAPAVCSPASLLMTMGSKRPPAHVHRSACTWTLHHPVRLRTTPVTVTCGPQLWIRSQGMPWQLKFVIFSAAALLISAQAYPKTILSLDHTALPPICGHPPILWENRLHSVHTVHIFVSLHLLESFFWIFSTMPKKESHPTRALVSLMFGAHTTRMTPSTGLCAQSCNIMSLLQRGMMHAWWILPSMHAVRFSAFLLRHRLVQAATHLALVYCIIVSCSPAPAGLLCRIPWGLDSGRVMI